MVWNVFKKREMDSTPLHTYLVDYKEGTVFGVTAETPMAAEEMVNEDVFHNQTIPGIPEVRPLDMKEIKKSYPTISPKTVRQKGIWFPSGD